jgi:hypothetical protein
MKTHEHGNSVLSSGSAERTIRGDGDGGNVTGVTEVVGAELALGEFPDLKSSRHTKSVSNSSGVSCEMML